MGFFLFGGFLVYADFSDYILSLENIGVSKTITKEKQVLYRNDVVRLLSTIQCNDCIHPSKEIKQQYSGIWRNKFISLPGNNFDDVLWENYIWQGEDYYYCIAQAADQGIINGYPRDISPFCPGRFCGMNLVKQGELLQIIFNIKKNNPKKNYSIDWNLVRSWLLNNKTPEIAKKNFTIDDRSLIEKNYKECNSKKCSIQNEKEMDIYAKYCTWNLSTCQMIDFNYIKEGQWPIAEINILMNEGVLNILQADIIKPYYVANSRQLLEYLYSFQDNVSCAFNTDYDRDEITNYLDNCSLNRNPTQANLDGDNKGDVCDEDIDGDGILNPIGIINSYGFIDYSVYISNSGSFRDNCPIVLNTDQNNYNNNKLGDACEGGIVGKGLGIKISTNGNTVEPSTIIFEAQPEGLPCSNSGYYRSFNNGKRFIGKKIQDVFNAGVINIGLVDCHNNIAYSTLIIDKKSINKERVIDFSLQIRSDPGFGIDGFTTVVTPEYSGNCSAIVWNHNGKISQKTIGKKPAKILIQGGGSHIIQAFCISDNDIIKAVAQSSVHVESSLKKYDEISAQLNVDKLIANEGEPIRFSTSIRGFNEKDISNISRDYDDGTTYGSKNLKVIHIYDTEGVKVIRQTITHKNGKILTNIIQLKIIKKKNVLDNGNNYGKYGFIANLNVKPRITKTNSIVDFEIITKQDDRISSIDRNFGDGNREKSNDLKTKHIYLKPGLYNVDVTIILKNGNTVQYGDQINVYNQDNCFDYLNEYSKNNTKKVCDSDKDIIPDICDDDIDDDGIKNPSGIILFDNPDCSINSGNINLNIINNSDPELDNCPFDKNMKQENKDKDNFGDVCDKQPDTPNSSQNPNADSDNDGIPNKDDNDGKDSDNDGIPDYIDNLVNVPLLSNSIPTSNLTPIIGSNEQNGLNDGSKIQNNCISCPCGFTQVLSPIAAGDIIYSTMKYDGGIIKSNNYTVK